jgi:hypothetical protein
MRSLRLALIPLLLAACADRDPVAPDIDAPPMLGATHASAVTTIPDMEWYTPMDCLGYDGWTPPNAVHWTASWIKIFNYDLYLPNGKLAHGRGYAEWSDDMQFETPSGDLWESVENADTQARLKMINKNQLLINADGDVTVDSFRWGCILIRPGR